MTSTLSCSPSRCSLPFVLGRGRRIIMQYAPPANPASPAAATVFCHQDAMDLFSFFQSLAPGIPAGYPSRVPEPGDPQGIRAGCPSQVTHARVPLPYTVGIALVYGEGDPRGYPGAGLN